jgi:serine/threonine protein kinase
VRDRATKAVRAISWDKTALAIEQLARNPANQNQMVDVLKGLKAYQAHPQLAALLDRLVNLLQGDLRNRAILLLEEKRLSLEQEKMADFFHGHQHPYQIRDVLGQGLFTAAYLARDEALDLDVVVRVLRPEFVSQPLVRARFLDLNRMAAKFVHQNLVPTRDVRAFPDQNLYYVVRDYVGGVTLQKVLEGGKEFTPLESLQIIRQVLEALTGIHGQGVAHGGIKPSNIFLCEGDRVLLGDLSLPIQGIGVDLDRLSYDYRYAAPEMFRGGGALGPPADLYSLGCVTYELLCGRPPFVSDNRFELAALHSRETIPTLTGHARELGHLSYNWSVLLQRLLNKSPESRFRTVAEALRSVDELAQARETGTSPAPARHLVGAESLARYEGERSRIAFHPKMTHGEPSAASLDSDSLPAAASPSEVSRPSAYLAAGNEPVPGYRLSKLLGRGGFGEVWKATGPGGIEVALKVLPHDNPSEAVESRALELIKNIRHPNLLALHGAWHQEDRLIIAMELADGTLADRLRLVRSQGEPGLTTNELMPYMEDAARGIDYLNQNDIQHRDIKPHNLMLVGGHVKVADFGLAKLMENQVVSHSVVGTPVYVPPEFWRGEVSTQSDQYALALTYCELRGGRLPFATETMAQIMMAHLNDPPDLSMLPAAERPVLARALAKNPQERWPNCTAFVRALLEAEQVRPAPAAAGFARGDSPALEDAADIVMARDLDQTIEKKSELLGARVGRATLPVEITPSLILAVDENVQFTVYRPRLVQPQKWYTLLAFAHLSERSPEAPADEPDPIEEVLRQAEQVLGEAARAYQEVTQDARQAVPRAGELTFLPEVAGVEFNPARRSFVWRESVHREEFRLWASQELEGQTARGRLTVFLGSILLADIPLTLRVETGQTSIASVPAMEKMAARPYRKIFASYSHHDLEIVRQFERFALTLGDQYLRDWTHLRSGEVWDERLLRLIDEADIFQLFWSSNSMRSAYVRQEWEYALSLDRPYFVRPTYWEEPLPTIPEQDLPPERLLRLHFQRIASDTARASAEPTATKPTETASTSDSSSEFELSPEGSDPLARREDEAVSVNEGEKDIFESDFEVPALEDESGSQAVALDEPDTDLESSDFDLALGEEDVATEDESGSQVVALEDEEEVDEGAATIARPRKSAAAAAEEEAEELLGEEALAEEKYLAEQHAPRPSRRLSRETTGNLIALGVGLLVVIAFLIFLWLWKP